jgi:hypothetical protein
MAACSAEWLERILIFRPNKIAHFLSERFGEKYCSVIAISRSLAEIHQRMLTARDVDSV